MNCKEFEEKIFHIDDYPASELEAMRNHVKCCENDHQSSAWMLDEISFEIPKLINPEKLKASILENINVGNQKKIRPLQPNFWRYAAALIAFLICSAFAWEWSEGSPIGQEGALYVKAESNFTFIKRVRQKSKTSSLFAEVRACAARCTNSQTTSCEDCKNLLANLNNNSK